MPFTILDSDQAREMEAAMAKPDQDKSWMNKPVTITYLGQRNTDADNPFGVGRQISGKKDKKYTEPATKSAKFAVRMQKELDVIEELERSGFSPINLRDQVVANMPFLRQEGMLNNMAKSGKYQIYDNAVRNFVMAQLRDVSGAVVGAEEIRTNMPLYMPILGDSLQTIKEKQERRRNVLSAMIASSQGAYEEFNQDLENSQAAEDASQAQKIRSSLELRAKTDPKLRAEIEEYKAKILRSLREQNYVPGAEIPSGGR